MIKDADGRCSPGAGLIDMGRVDLDSMEAVCLVVEHKRDPSAGQRNWNKDTLEGQQVLDDNTLGLLLVTVAYSLGMSAVVSLELHNQAERGTDPLQDTAVRVHLDTHMLRPHNPPEGGDSLPQDEDCSHMDP